MHCHIATISGTPDLIAYISKCRLNVSPEVKKIITKYSGRERDDSEGSERRHRTSWLSFCTAECPRPSPDSFDLLDKLLVYDQEVRLTAREAMAHPFFDAVRDRVNKEVQALPKGSRTSGTKS